MRKLLLFLFSHRLLAIARWDIHFIGVRFANFVGFQGSKIRRALNQRSRPLFLNLGSGPRGLSDPHWINVDGFKDRNVQFLIDFNRRMPFPDSIFEGVFCEHVLEHFSLEDGERLASDVHRTLLPGGYFRVVVPDAALALRRYFESPDALIAWRNEGGTAMEVVNSVFRQRYEHQFLYDFITIQRMLLRAGFAEVTLSAFGGSRHPALSLDDRKYEWESLYVDAVKAP